MTLTLKALASAELELANAFSVESQYDWQSPRVAAQRVNPGLKLANAFGVQADAGRFREGAGKR